MSDFVVRKNVQFFYKVDSDRDGVVERSDYIEAGARIATALGLRHGSTEGDACVSALEGMWDAYCAPADADGDGRVTLFEWLGLFQAWAQDGANLRTRHEAAHEAILKAMDRSGDGNVSLKEYVAFVSAGLNVPRPVVEAAFQVLDTDRDGVISKQEFMQATWDYHMSTDQGVAGNQFYGGY